MRAHALSSRVRAYSAVRGLLRCDRCARRTLISRRVAAGVVYEDILKGPAMLLAPVVKKCSKLLKESDGDIQKKHCQADQGRKTGACLAYGWKINLAEQKMTDPGLSIPLFVVDAVQYILRHGACVCPRACARACVCVCACVCVRVRMCGVCA